MKQLWIIANWKSNKTVAEALDWIGKVGPSLHLRENIKVVVCPQFDCLEDVKKAIQIGNFPILVGSQDLSPFGEGAYTGEETARNLAQFVSLAILGHSERRQNFSETDETIAQKVVQAGQNNILPLVCVQGRDTPIPEGCKLVAYEPVFAIGTEHPDTPQDAEDVAQSLKQLHTQKLEVLYGGSVNHQNCSAFIKQENISGLLIGKSSLDSEEFLQIIQVCQDSNV